MKQTICVSSTPGDATAEARRVAENIRATGKVVSIGTEYTQMTGHKAGMLAVDLTIEDAPPADAKAVLDAIAVTDFAALSALVPLAEGADLSQGPDAVADDEGFVPDRSRSKRSIREREARHQ